MKEPFTQTFIRGKNGWRTPCVVPGCPRSRAGRWSWICCADHWRPVSKELKTLRTKIKSRFRRRGEVENIPGGWRCTTSRANRAINGIDRRLIKDAIERACGI